MANYNYFDFKDVLNAVSCCERHCNAIIILSHGDRVYLSAFNDDGGNMIRVERKGFSGVCKDLGDLILCCFTKDNVRMRYLSVVTGKIYWLRYWDMVRVNNPKLSEYLSLYIKETGERIIGRVGFNVKPRNERG